MGSNINKTTSPPAMYVRFFTYVKNEITFIERWLNHHSSISKWFLLHVVDNGSTDGTLELLQKYKKQNGINIYHHDNYAAKGVYLSSLMKRYQNQDSILIPIDGDEFLSLVENENINTDPVCIREYLQSLPRNGNMYRTYGTLFSTPHKSYNENPFKDITKWKWKWNTERSSKKFYYSKTFKSTDHGNHNGISTSKNYTSTNITYLHYHDIGRDHYQKKCEQDINALNLKISEFKDSNNTSTGCEKARALLNINKWNYSDTEPYDIIFKWDK